ncbi:hypothetical protein Clacol_005523 [Clathrus columnatus]|uniref:Nucleolar 27S pre-rRNA processing Urb2/Npa2 C-terminal domain-containing protein n=1 Tax=Clathrus columnatus TaxID=1419009 RepID=A0AAV5AE89_9AGAM|nr:hypothetical protein Clacol_005523 [Clathrus columnatus]
MNEALVSAHSFVRALKAPTDPPHEEWPTKIRLARAAWENNSVRIQRKAGIILEWLLPLFTKAISKTDSQTQPVLSHFHWELLADVLSNPGDTPIAPIVLHFPIASYLSTIFIACRSLPPESADTLFLQVHRSLTILWPMSTQTGLDMLSECFWASLSVIKSPSSTYANPHVVAVMVLVWNYFQQNFDMVSASQKKKVYTAFSQHIADWLFALQSNLESIHTEQIYRIGKQVLSNVDSLRFIVDAKQTTSLSPSSFLFNENVKSDHLTRLSLLRILPRLYKDYLENLHIYQYVIFPSSLNAAQVQDRFTEIGTNFAIQILRSLESLESPDDQLQLWDVTVNVLLISEQEQITTIKEKTEWMSYLCSLRQRALAVLNNSWDETQAVLLRHSLDVLSFLHRVEPELINPILPSILERVALSLVTQRQSSPQVTESASILLNQLLSFSSKTRTLHAFIAMLQEVLKCSFPHVSDMDAQKIYQFSICSPLMSFTFFDKLKYALLTFISPGQAKAIIEGTKVVLMECVKSYSSASSLKRRKLLGGQGSIPVPSGGSEIGIVSFCLLVRFNSVIVEALVHEDMSNDVQGSTGYLDALDDCVSTVLDRLLSSSKNFNPEGTPLLKKRKESTGELLEWSDQCFLESLLRLSYDLFVHYDYHNSRKTPKTILSYTDTMTTFMQEKLIPDLQLEIGRWFTYAATRTISRQESKDKYLDTLLDYIEQHGTLKNLQSNGEVLYPSSSHVALVLLGYLLENRLPEIDAFASRLQLERIVRLLIRHIDCMRPNYLSIGAIIDRLFQRASFWEMQNIKATLQSVLDQETSFLISKHAPVTPNMDWSILRQSIKCSPSDMERVAVIYKLSLRFPSNYLSKKSRDDLILKALNADVFTDISHLQEHPTVCNKEINVACRAFLSKSWNEQPSKLLEELVLAPSWMDYFFGKKFPVEDPFHQEKLNGMRVAILRLAIQNTLKGDTLPLDNILRASLNYEVKLGQDLNDMLIRSPLVLLINSIIDSTKRSRLYETTISLINEIRTHLNRWLEPSIEQLLRADSNTFGSSGGIVKGWKMFLSLTTWILDEPPEPSNLESISQRLFRRTIQLVSSPYVDSEFCSDILSIVLIQSKLSRGNGVLETAGFLAGYLLMCSARPPSSFDKPLSQLCKALTLGQYEALLDSLAEYLEKQVTKVVLHVALHASILLLKQAPEKSSKISSNYVSRCLRVLTNTDVSRLSSPEIHQVLVFLRFQCSERAITLQTLDVSGILTIIHSMTDGSPDHNTNTSYSIFQNVVSILDDLVRLRHDLLNSFFPHISEILRRLISLLRTIRPQLGTKQYRLLANAYPRWINPLESFGESGGAGHLARLLTMFTTKTLVRSRGNNELPKAASLARSFARHAPYVLLAYLQAASDPLTYMTAQVRKELQPGLFALCAMTGEHGRDTLMIQNLSAEQKVLLKTLWGNYVKQKYTGKG